MTSANGPQGPNSHKSDEISVVLHQSIECQLFESLVHHLMEKGVLTKNDALSVVQTVAQVHRGALEEQRTGTGQAENGLAILERLYSSFELVSDRPSSSQAWDASNVLQLRPPLHGEHSDFPRDD